MEKQTEAETKKTEKIKTTERIVLIYIFVISIVNLLIASYIELNKAFTVDPCFREMAGCAIVDASAFSDIAGLPLTIIGIFAFFMIALLSFSQIKNPTTKKKRIMFFILLAATLFSVYLILAQVFIIKAICKYCLVIDLLTISMFLTFLAFLR